MIEVSILIPTNDNTGHTFTPQHDQAFEAFLAGEFGGFSRLPGVVAGGWVEGGIYYPDEHRVYVVALNSITEGGKIKTAADFAKAHFAQLGIYIRYLGLSEIL